MTIVKTHTGIKGKTLNYLKPQTRATLIWLSRTLRSD